MPQARQSADIGRLPKLDRHFKDAVIRALPPQKRAGTEEDDGFKRFELSVSSEYPVRRWFGNEILVHTKDAVDLSRMQDGAPVLHQHDGGQQIGVVESARVENKRLVAVVKFSRSNPLAVQIAADMEDGIRRNVSVGYLPQRAKLAAYSDEDGDTWEIERWQPMEFSIVGVPADPTVGMDRSQPTFPVEVDRTLIRSTTMETPEQKAAREAAERAAAAAAAPSVTAGNNAAANTRAAEIVRLCVKYGLGERAAEFINSDKDANAVAREILEARAGAQQAAAPTRTYAAMPAINHKDMRRYSYARALLGACLLREGKGNLDGLELEVHQEIERHLPVNYQRKNGVLVPMDTRTDEDRFRAMDSITSGKAPELVNQQPGELIELLRNVARVIGMGATVLPGLTGPVPFPKQKGGMTAAWTQENPGSDAAGSDPTFGTVTLNPKTLIGSGSFSRQLLIQASLNVEQLVRRELAIAHGLAVDLAALHGSGTGNEPLGIYKTPDVNTQAMAGNPTYVLLVAMLGKVADDNAYLGNLGWLTTALMAAKLMTTLEFASSGSTPIWKGNMLDGQMTGYKAAATNQVSKLMSTLEPTGGTEHGMVFGNWSDLLIGFWGAMELITDPFTKAKKGMIDVTSFQMADVAARHGESFCVATGATTA